MVGAEVPQVEEEDGERSVIIHKQHKVAIASADGRTIASHLGTAPFFVVYTVKKGRVSGEELRENPRAHSRRIEDTQSGCWELIEELLPDVKVVISRGMGENAYVGLLRRDMLPINTDEEDTENAIRAYLGDHLDDDPSLIHQPRREGYEEAEVDEK